MDFLGNIDGVKPYVAQEEGKLVQGTMQDCTPILEDAQERHASGQHGTSDMRHAARLPTAIVETYMNLHGIDLGEFLRNPVHVKRMLNDPDLKGFRIWGGRV
jgi:hypothetical protein